MRTIKVIPRFFRKMKAKEMADYQAKCLKKQGRVDFNVKVEDAYGFFVLHKWFKKNPFGIKCIPQPGDFLVIIYYGEEILSPVAEKKIELAKKIKSDKLKQKRTMKKQLRRVEENRPEPKLRSVVCFHMSIFALTYNYTRRLAA